MVQNIKKEEKKEEKIYPSLVLGLDISTSCIGVSIVYDDGKNVPSIYKITHIVPKIPNKKKGIEALILRKKIFEDAFLNDIKDLGITECVIESPMEHTSGKSTAHTVAQLLQFNGLISEAVYDALGIVPHFVSSFDARKQSFPELLSLRKFNKKGIAYPLSHYKKAIKDGKLVPFGSFPFDSDKKSIMMDLVSEKYPDLEWVRDNNGEFKKENYDACDSLVCSLAYINTKRNGELDEKIESFEIDDSDKEKLKISYKTKVWGVIYDKKIVVDKVQNK